MRVFVTGGAGYIGSVTSRLLLDEGMQVTVFDNLETGHKAALDTRADFIHGDLRNENEIADAVCKAAPDAVLHFAAYALVGESCLEPGKYFRNNVQGGLNLLEAMRKENVGRIVFSSTCATYGQPDRMPIVETTPQRPSNPYGQSKLMFEQMLSWYSEIHRFKPISLRYFNACGASDRLGEDHTPETHLMPNILAVALGKKERITVFGDDYATEDGTCIRDYIHVEDLARAHLMALTSTATGALNLGTGRGFSVLEIVEAARRVTGHAIAVEIGARRPGDPDILVANPARANSTLGWQAQFTDPEVILTTAWKWHQQHPDGYSGNS